MSCCLPPSREDSDASRQLDAPGSRIRVCRPQGGKFLPPVQLGSLARKSRARNKAVCVLRGNANTRVARHLSIKGTAQYNKAFSLRPSPEPPSNLPLNRTRYGMPALGLHFILAQARHASAGRLALR